MPLTSSPGYKPTPNPLKSCISPGLISGSLQNPHEEQFIKRMSVSEDMVGHRGCIFD